MMMEATGDSASVLVDDDGGGGRDGGGGGFSDATAANCVAAEAAAETEDAHTSALHRLDVYKANARLRGKCFIFE